MRPWNSLPTWWYRSEEPGLVKLLGGARSGDSQAALRVVLGIASSDERPIGTFRVGLSLSELQDSSQLSRPKVLAGVALAQEHGFIRVERGGPTARNTYELVCPEFEAGESGGWAKMPNAEVLTRIPRLPHRGARALVALKVYMTLLAARQKGSAVVPLRHVTLREKTGAQPTDIRRAISMLAAEGLIDVNTEDPAERWQPADDRHRRAQRYHLVGKFADTRTRSNSVSPNGAGGSG